MRRILVFFKTHRHQILFGLAIFSLASLLAWWSVFIHRSITVQRQLRLDLLTAELKSIAARLNALGPESLSSGVLGLDNRFEIATSPGAGSSIRLEGGGFHLRPSTDVLNEIDRKNRSLMVMWIGESGLLSLIILACIIFLYRNIQVERRTLREVREFWERSAHEIKTPIAGLKAFLQNLRSQPADLGPMGSYVDLALRQVDRQEKLADNILAGYRLELDLSRPRLDSVDLHTFLDGYFSRDALHLFEARVERTYSGRPALKVRADTRFLKVILDNITVNAVRYGPSALVLTVDTGPVSGKAEIRITDNGPGFPPPLTENIFQAYRQLNEELPATLHGTGLGLFISRRLARAMGGDLRASSPGPGQGACLILSVRAETDAA